MTGLCGVIGGDGGVDAMAEDLLWTGDERCESFDESWLAPGTAT